MAEGVFTGNLVLKTRVAVLTRNLEDMQRALESVEERRADLREILKLRGQVASSTGAIRRELGLAKEAYDDQSRDEHKVLEDFVRAFERVLDELSALDTALASSKDPAMRLGLPLPVEDGDTQSIGGLLQNEIDQEFLKWLQKQVTVPSKPAGMRKAWTEYAEKLHGSSEKLFEEYVELVGGLAIRDTGFDRGISRIADELIKPFGDWADVDHTWKSLAIPARQEALRLTSARIIRLGFPDWTMWTLPLAAHEFGHIFANWNDAIDVAASHERQVCFADAFATYVMGPAYACAAILMRLDPAAAFSKDDGTAQLDAKRVEVILYSLERMSATGVRKNEDLFGPIRTRLQQEWQEALRQVGSAGSLPDGDRDELRTWVEDFEDFVRARRLSPDHWPMIEEWARLLSAGELDSIDIQGGKELRHVLNAAWRARIAVEEGEADVDDMESVRNLALAAEVLWRRIEQPEQAEQARGGRDQVRQPRRQWAVAQNEPEVRP